MRLHEQRNELVEAIKLALSELRSGPPLGAFGIAREDCALAHIDYFAGISSASMVLCSVIAEVEGITPAEAHKLYGASTAACDCRSCVGKQAATAAEKKHRDAYTNVGSWKDVE